MPQALTLLAALLLAGCSASQMATPAVVELVLLPPSEGPAPVLLKQKITLLAGQRQQQFLAVARFEHDRLELVVLLPGGQRLLTLGYDGEELLQESLASIDLKGRDILATNYESRDAVFSARDRCDETVEHMRCVRTDRFKYIRNFLPQRPHLQPCAYKDKKSILVALRAANEAGTLNDVDNQ